MVTLQDMTPLDDLERLRAEFLAMVSHELRMPLTSIRGSATALLDDGFALDPAEMRQFHRIILDQTDRMRRLISDLLDVARIETGSLSVNPGPADVTALVDEARNTFLSGCRRENLYIELPPDLPHVIADRWRIVQVLGNLLSNAARHSDEASRITVTAVVKDLHVAVSVADEGRGVSAERLPHLFRKFSRVGGEDSSGDTGLGLAICKGIVEAHGGRIWADSDGPGLGTRFTFTIPAVEEAGTAVTTVPARLSNRTRQGKKESPSPSILVVDDDPQTLRYVRDTLSNAGYAPVVTGDPEEVDRLIQENDPQVVLLDMMLPGTDGVELMKSILEVVDVPVIFLSAYGQEELVARAFDMGAVDYVVKPFSPTELAARIRAALRRRAEPYRAEPSEPYILGDLTINYAERSVAVAGRAIHFTATEYGVLFELSVNRGRVLTHDQLLRRVWGLGRASDSGMVRTVVKRLRDKLGDDAKNPTYIFTKPRVGYRMAKPE